MLKKFKLEKVTGVVALSYLILIPAGSFYAWQRLKQMEEDVTYLWEKTGMPPVEPRPVVDLSGIKEGFQRAFRG